MLTNERDSGGGVPGRDVNTAEQMRGERRKQKSRKEEDGAEEPRTSHRDTDLDKGLSPEHRPTHTHTHSWNTFTNKFFESFLTSIFREDHIKKRLETGRTSKQMFQSAGGQSDSSTAEALRWQHGDELQHVPR